MSDKYKVAIIGCGGMGASHARAWSGKDQVEIVGFADVSQESADKLAAEYGVSGYADYNQLIAENSPDIVSVTTWQNVRADITVAAADAGVKGILGEKPMAASSGESADMLEACERNGVKLAIGHQRRYLPQNVATRRLGMEGAVEPPTGVL